MSLVWAELDPYTGLAIRIFNSRKAMFLAMPYVEDGPTKSMERGLAVSQIRRQIWDRQQGLCLRCGEIIRWVGSHLHEKIHRGEGGEISLENSELLCAACHIGPQGVHSDRQVKFTK